MAFRPLLPSPPGQTSVSGIAIADTTDDEARPDREESELLFGAAIHWLRPGPRRAHLDDATLPVEAESGGAPGSSEAALGAASVGGAAAFDAAPDPESEPRPSNRRRNLLIALGAAVTVLAVVAVLALSGGGGGKADVATGNRPAATTAPATTRVPASTTLPAPADAKVTPAGTTVTVNADVLFDVGSSDLTSAASARLGSVLELARTDPSRHLLVEGFTDSDGDPTFNQQLSEARAQSVASWMISQGIDPARISVVGHGADNPVAPNDTPENKALNRRVVVTLQTAKH